ncbi:hypothetical protein [Cognatishimia sp. F0-27]|uniref:hypothetical protein n=1 Tax=Cognatishimia sp. F0-27 TaxID=2816855 RepID=UPI001D0C5F77|nr:hypothetical protein [Cognatishimia sp. F0-27]MCC1494519.1 hypothetical protein [Cognatishimia sp. F0-27]
MLKLILALALSVAALPALADVTSRSGGPSKSEMLARSNPGAPDGAAFFRPVLDGVLYRGGFSGGDKGRTGLSSGQRQQLCGEGFSRGFYADFGKNTDFGTTSCGGGSFNYQAARSSRPANVMKAIHDTIVSNDGPVYVHCMWGVHSSGALSAMALVQFCGWSERRAKAYWNEARNGAPCSGGCDAWIDGKFERFKVDASLSISDAQRAAICPKD